MFAIQTGYKYLNKRPLPHHLFFISFNQVDETLVWHWINLSHIEKGSYEDKVTALILPRQVSISLHLLLLPSPSSPSLPVCLLQPQLTPKVTRLLPCFIPWPHLCSTRRCCNYIEAYWRHGWGGVKVTACEKTPACSPWPPTAAVHAGVYGWHPAPTQSPSSGTEAHTYRLVGDGD